MSYSYESYYKDKLELFIPISMFKKYTGMFYYNLLSNRYLKKIR